MVEEKTDPKDEEDIDAQLKEASAALIREMEELIRRAKILQAEHRALVAGAARTRSSTRTR